MYICKCNDILCITEKDVLIKHDYPTTVNIQAQTMETETKMLRKVNVFCKYCISFILLLYIY